MKPTLAILTLFSLSANAIIMRHDRDPKLYQVKQDEYENVIDMKYMTATLIAPQWVVTAAHATHILPANFPVTINGQNYQVKAIVPHPLYDPENQNNDIALLKLNMPVSGIVPTAIYERHDEKNKHVWFAGSGYVGNGETGVTGPSKTLNHAENIIDDVGPLWINFDFDKPQDNALELEGISGPGDSGGPAFIDTDKGLQIAGVSSHQLNDDDTPEGMYGVGERYTRVSQYTGWIKSTLEKSGKALKKVALSRVNYQQEQASVQETNALLGSYLLQSGSELVLAKCKQENICYSFVGEPGESAIYKTQNSHWFTPNLNRAFEIIKTKDATVTEILLKDFMGERTATRISKKR